MLGGSHPQAVSVAIAEGEHPVPSRTRKLSPPAPMVLPWQRGGRVGRRRDITSIEGPPRGGPSSCPGSVPGKVSTRCPRIDHNDDRRPPEGHAKREPGGALP